MFFQRLGKLVFRRNLKMTTSLNRGLIILSLLTVLCRANELKDYCSIHKFDNLPPGGLRFTKEVVTTEYANIGAFKALHCCLRGYRSIEWWVTLLFFTLIFSEKYTTTKDDKERKIIRRVNDWNTNANRISSVRFVSKYERRLNDAFNRIDSNRD